MCGGLCLIGGREGVGGIEAQIKGKRLAGGDLDKVRGVLSGTEGLRGEELGEEVDVVGREGNGGDFFAQRGDAESFDCFEAEGHRFWFVDELADERSEHFGELLRLDAGLVGEGLADEVFGFRGILEDGLDCFEDLGVVQHSGDGDKGLSVHFFGTDFVPDSEEGFFAGLFVESLNGPEEVSGRVLAAGGGEVVFEFTREALESHAGVEALEVSLVGTAEGIAAEAGFAG